MPVKCFDCGGEGHIAAECPDKDALDTRPPWCGICDPRTRLVTVDLDTGTVEKCKNCHKAPSKPLVQHKRCPACKMTVYAWDTSPCGMHESPVAPDRRLTIGEIHEIERANS